MKEFWKSILSDNPESLSSKRLAGLSGWVITMIVIIICTIKETQAPNILEFFIICSTTLLGVDSVASVFKKNSKFSSNTTTSSTTMADGSKQDIKSESRNSE